ncbi:RmlC-like cupin domain [Pseudocohnilembus persalinus]|uniref:RmlC-like cupin domain n=1 Tax=Pseudocohnilembus persalinus TaxID=266149 RepID=A0A0V0R7D5_PSEPJ|nr:RmlC-like cupin domain [Pseudocohnilembus persalinus]|eukprot:KRX10407.1 RmlC-like cupin domain [Pseudocohnilembus persalinus]
MFGNFIKAFTGISKFEKALENCLTDNHEYFPQQDIILIRQIMQDQDQQVKKIQGFQEFQQNVQKIKKMQIKVKIKLLHLIDLFIDECVFYYDNNLRLFNQEQFKILLFTEQMISNLKKQIHAFEYLQKHPQISHKKNSSNQKNSDQEEDQKSVFAKSSLNQHKNKAIQNNQNPDQNQQIQAEYIEQSQENFLENQVKNQGQILNSNIFMDKCQNQLDLMVSDFYEDSQDQNYQNNSYDQVSVFTMNTDGTCPIRKEFLIKQLGLIKHAEGGYFIRTFCSKNKIQKVLKEENQQQQELQENKQQYQQQELQQNQQESNIILENKIRPQLSSIHYLLTKESPIGHFVYNKSDIVHYFQEGKSLRYYIVDQNGNLRVEVLGKNLEKGEKLQVIVEGGCWKANELVEGEYGLLGEGVGPAFEYEDSKLGDQEFFKKQFPKIFEQIKHLIYEDELDHEWKIKGQNKIKKIQFEQLWENLSYNSEL